MRAQAAGSPGVSDARRTGHHHHRDRRHRRRHRVAALPRGCPPGAPRPRPRQLFFLHVSLVPYLAPSGELKTKPTQHSVAALRQVGIQPDALVLRADREIPESIKRKISLMCDVDTEAVAAAVDAPQHLRHPEGAAPRGVGRLRHPPARADLPRRRLDGLGPAPRAGPRARARGRPSPWSASTSTCPTPTSRSPRRCGQAASTTTPRSRSGGSPPTPATPRRGRSAPSAGSMPCSCPAASACAVSRARSARCAGPAPTSSRRSGSAWVCSAWSSSTPATSPGSRARARPSSTPRARLRSSRRWRSRRRSSRVPATWAGRCGWVRSGLLLEGSVVAGAYGATFADERHRHRYEVNNDYRQQLEDAGLVVQRHPPRAGARRVRRAAADVHPYYVSTQAHPEFKSRPTRAHPLFAGLVGAAIEAQRASRLVEVERPRHHEAADAHA
jgi:CTP synthase